MLKALPFKIPKKRHESITIQIDKATSFYNKLHQHEEIQISYIKKGEGKLLIADSAHSFKKDAIFCIGSNNPHLFQADKNCPEIQMISLFFTQKSFENSFINIPELSQLNQFFIRTELNFKVYSNTNDLQQLMNAIVKSKKLTRLILFFQIIQKIINGENSVLSEFKSAKKISDSEGKRMQVVFDYVMNNFQNIIVLENVAALVFMTPNAFCRFFKQRTNKTFFQFLIQLRIAHACQLLENKTDISMENLALASGFNSVSNFNRQFKSLKKCSPSSYKREL